MFGLRWTLMIGALAAVAFSHAAQTLVFNVGQPTQRVVIRSSPKDGSKVLWNLKPFVHILVRPHNANWYQLVLRDGRFGYVKSAQVAMLPHQYEVTIGAKTAPSSTGGTRGNTLPASRSRQELAGYAMNYLGTKYVWGGNDLQNGIDCSGFVKQLYGRIGLSLPRTAAEQALVGKKIERLEHLQPGDRLYFWEDRRNKIGHTGIYLGDGWFVHANSGAKQVSTDYLTEKWLKILVGARR